MIDASPSAPPISRLNRTLVLVGLMGAGKTSVGKRLASLLHAPFADSDHEIEAAAQMTIPEIFRLYGEGAFRDLERRVLGRLVTEAPRVLATGGGAFIEARTREAIRGQAVSIWLNADVDTLWERVRDKPGRPLLQDPNAHGVLSALMEKRYPVYALADIVVDSRRGISHDAMARAIIEAVCAHDRAHPDRPPSLEPSP
jgi:shikimate kinase